VRHGGGVTEIVGGDYLEVSAALKVRPEEVAPDSPETVDPNSNSHRASPSLSHRV
jgi:hypothetical protein